MPISPPTAVLATNVVVFTIRDDLLVVLLRSRPREPFQGVWSLPGGLVGDNEGLEDCAVRTLRDQTGVRGVYLEQLYTFGRPDRDPRGRVVTVAHYALVPPAQLHGLDEDDGQRCWQPVNELPSLAFDHDRIVAMAHQRLAAKLDYSTIALQFMGERFTLSELQRVYEIILGEPLDKRNFRKRVGGLPCIEQTGDWFRAGNHRPARLYRVKQPGRVDIIK
ncbi:MAG: NUDIX hydrolase [Ectothiorhodospiraceae bacterium]|nr:NUDIX hydrolase [Ectothiorhodospiraceae bacterium]